MKKTLFIAAVMGCLFVAGQSVAGESRSANGSSPANNSCPQKCCPTDHSCGDCWCRYVHYKPCYYNTYKNVCEPVHYKKRCCRQVPQYYQVRCCRYVPQYYCEQKCRYVNQYYDVDECGTCQKCVACPHCKYTPCYYWKHTCENPCNTGCPANGNGNSNTYKAK